MRNYWMYGRQQGSAPASLKAIAQGMWPRFPGLPGKTAIRLEGDSSPSLPAVAAIGGGNTELARVN
jgi:hypothetical protein